MTYDDVERTHLTEDDMRYLDTHSLGIETDRCRCGGEWVYFEPEHTHGCEVAGPPDDVVLNDRGRDVEIERW